MLRQIKWPTDSAQVTYDVAKIAGLYVIPVESLMFPFILDFLLFKWTLSIITWIRQDPNRLPPGSEMMLTPNRLKQRLFCKCFSFIQCCGS